MPAHETYALPIALTAVADYRAAVDLMQATAERIYACGTPEVVRLEHTPAAAERAPRYGLWLPLGEAATFVARKVEGRDSPTYAIETRLPQASVGVTPIVNQAEYEVVLPPLHYHGGFIAFHALSRTFFARQMGLSLWRRIASFARRPHSATSATPCVRWHSAKH